MRWRLAKKLIRIDSLFRHGHKISKQDRSAHLKIKSHQYERYFSLISRQNCDFWNTYERPTRAKCTERVSKRLRWYQKRDGCVITWYLAPRRIN